VVEVVPVILSVLCLVLYSTQWILLGSHPLLFLEELLAKLGLWLFHHGHFGLFILRYDLCGRVLQQDSLKFPGLGTVKGPFAVVTKEIWHMIKLLVLFFIFYHLKVSRGFTEDVLVSVVLAKLWAKPEWLIPKVFIWRSFIWLVLKIQKKLLTIRLKNSWFALALRGSTSGL